MGRVSTETQLKQLEQEHEAMQVAHAESLADVTRKLELTEGAAAKIATEHAVMRGLLEEDLALLGNGENRRAAQEREEEPRTADELRSALEVRRSTFARAWETATGDKQPLAKEHEEKVTAAIDAALGGAVIAKRRASIDGLVPAAAVAKEADPNNVKRAARRAAREAAERHANADEVVSRALDAAERLQRHPEMIMPVAKHVEIEDQDPRGAAAVEAARAIADLRQTNPAAAARRRRVRLRRV